MTTRVIFMATLGRNRTHPRKKRRDPMAPKTASETTQSTTEMFTGMQAKALDAFAALAETNQRVLQGFVDLSVSAARESMRAYAELQSAAVDAARATAQPADA